jgi:HEAT repeat protein
MAGYALHLLGDRRAVEPLIARLADEDLTTVLIAMKTLGELGDARAVDPLIAQLDHRLAGVAAWAVEALETLPMTAGQRSRLCSPATGPLISSAAPAAPGSTPPPP